MPQNTAIAGPEQVQNSFETLPSASIELTQLRRGGSQVTLGNLITLPVGGALLYIEPVYVQASGTGNGSYPTLRRVFVYFNGSTGYAPTLQASLGQVFSGLPSQPSRAISAPPAPSTGSGNGQLSAAVRGFLAQAESHYQAAQQALKRGDFATYGQELRLLKQALDEANRAAQPVAKHGASPSPSPSPTRWTHLPLP